MNKFTELCRLLESKIQQSYSEGVTLEDAEKLADDPDNFETPKQLMDFINKIVSQGNKLMVHYFLNNHVWHVHIHVELHLSQLQEQQVFT